MGVSDEEDDAHCVSKRLSRYVEACARIANMVRPVDFSVSLADPMQDDCPLVAVSAGFTTLTGYPAEEIIGRNCRFLQEGVPQDMIVRDSQVEARKFVEKCRNFKESDSPGVHDSCLISQVNATREGELFHNDFLLHYTVLCDHPFIIGLQVNGSAVENSSLFLRETLQSLYGFFNQRDLTHITTIGKISRAGGKVPVKVLARISAQRPSKAPSLPRLPEAAKESQSGGSSASTPRGAQESPRTPGGVSEPGDIGSLGARPEPGSPPDRRLATAEAALPSETSHKLSDSPLSKVCWDSEQGIVYKVWKQSRAARRHAAQEYTAFLHLTRGASGSCPLLFATFEIVNNRPMSMRQPYVGPDLTFHSRFYGELGFGAVAAVARSVGAALKYIHERRYVHSDVKPKNIAARWPVGTPAPEQVVLLDFGLATPLDRASARPLGTIAGTEAYASIQVHRGDALKPQDDYSSLVYTLRFIESGVLPWTSRSGKVRSKYQQAAEQVFRNIQSAVTHSVQSVLGELPDAATATGPGASSLDVLRFKLYDLLVLSHGHEGSRLTTQGADRELWAALLQQVGDPVVTLDRIARALDDSQRGDMLFSGERGFPVAPDPALKQMPWTGLPTKLAFATDAVGRVVHVTQGFRDFVQENQPQRPEGTIEGYTLGSVLLLSNLARRFLSGRVFNRCSAAYLEYATIGLFTLVLIPHSALEGRATGAIGLVFAQTATETGAARLEKVYSDLQKGWPALAGVLSRGVDVRQLRAGADVAPTRWMPGKLFEPPARQTSRVSDSAHGSDYGGGGSVCNSVYGSSMGSDQPWSQRVAVGALDDCSSDVSVSSAMSCASEKASELPWCFTENCSTECQKDEARLDGTCMRSGSSPALRGRPQRPRALSLKNSLVLSIPQTPQSMAAPRHGDMLAIPGLVVGKELSRGGFKRHRVYTVVVSAGAPSWTQPHSTIAVKFFEHETMLCPAFIDFEREAEALKSIHHEHVVSALHTLINDRWSAIFMPLVSGVSLHSIPILLCADVEVIVPQVLEGLHAVHLAGFAHRDISVHNVLYDAARGRATLLDFDYCCKIVETQSGVSTDCPHSEYRAPAAYRGTVLARDIWSMGILVAKVLQLVDVQDDPSFHDEGSWWTLWSSAARTELQVHSAESRVTRERNAAARALAAKGRVAWYARLLQRLLYLYPSQRVLPALRSPIDVLIPG